MHSFASLNQGRLSSVFLSTKDFTYQYPSPPHKYIMKSWFWKFCFFPFQEVFFFLTFLTPLDGTGFSPKLPVGGVDDYLARIMTELLPWAQQRFGLSPEPAERQAIRWSGDIVGCALWS